MLKERVEEIERKEAENDARDESGDEDKDEDELDDEDNTIAIEQGAVVYSQTCQFSSVTRDQLRDEGLLTKKDRKELHRSWIYKRDSKKTAAQHHESQH